MEIDIRLPEPNPKQRRFLNAGVKFVCFGGARGGGKSWAIRVKALLMALQYPGIRILIVRKTYPELMRNHVAPMKEMIPASVARYNKSEKAMYFINRSTIEFMYCASESDLDHNQGIEYELIFIDEATQHEEIIFTKLTACLRTTKNYPTGMYLTCNPGGIGHAWVKRLFIDKKYKDGENPADYVFIQSLVTDNKALMRANPDYKKQLEALPAKLRKAWLHGEWDLFEGQFFEEFVNNPNPERKNTHVIEGFTPPGSWRRFRSYDWGYAKPFSCAWWALDHDGRLYRILELYGCTETPNEGVKWTTDEQFRQIARVEQEHPWLRGCHIEGVADPSIFAQDGGVSIADTAAKHGVYFGKGDNKRIPGWMQVHYRMRFDENGYPMLYVFDNCKAFIRTIPLLVYDEHIPEDVDTDGEDHVADEVRYMCMLNPIAPPKEEEPKPMPYDPLGIDWGRMQPNSDRAFLSL